MLKIIYIAVTVFCIMQIAGKEAIWADNIKSPFDIRKEMDSRGKEWLLNDWMEDSRPYAKPLIVREKLYREKWGEDWFGRKCVKYKKHYIMSPGRWEWEEFAVIPNGKKACPYHVKSHYHRWNKAQALAFAPGGSDEVTGVYVLAKYGFYFIHPRAKHIQYEGLMPDTKVSFYKGAKVYVSEELDSRVMMKDGLDGKFRMMPMRKKSGEWATVDRVTGRIYFTQKTNQGIHLRYIERLLEYYDGDKKVLLPSIIDYNKIYTKINGPYGNVLVPAYNNNVPSVSRFAVHTTPVVFGMLPGRYRLGRKILLSPDGKVTYVAPKALWPIRFGKLKKIEIDTGKIVGSVPDFQKRVPKGYCCVPHGATCSQYDNKLYQCSHAGSMGDPGVMYSIGLSSGNVHILYDSLGTYPNLRLSDKKPTRQEMKQDKNQFHKAIDYVGTVDGPADAISLKMTTTCFQNQCPRTGAIISGGWDAAGLRRYHDGFVTTLAMTAQMGGTGGRPEWGEEPVASFGSLQSNPSITPDGDMYLTSCHEYRMFPGDGLREDAIRVIRLWRTDWPDEQPVNHYANGYFSKREIETRMIEYAIAYVQNYKQKHTNVQ